ncbi:ABC transporter permease [Bradyrhizobium sp. dw_411]|uniref:ABC transporter permease n=1 Tax=Bradyrhizobium sp. dw_411 TaxID=2720082 RepID=UPI001BCB3280|nr:ABC transporter permease [Bradyrhizobium sp. dw_411]
MNAHVDAPAVNRWRPLGLAAGLVVASMALTGLVLLPIGINPIAAYAQILKGAFGSVNAVTEDLVYATPIILTSLSVILAFRCGLWNLGSDGQLYLGAIATVGLGFNRFGLPGPALLPAMAVAAFAAGAAWAAVPAVLRLRFGASEVIVTIMMNFLAVTIATYLVGGPWASGITPATAPIVPEGFLPVLISGTRLNANFLVAIAAAAILSFVLRRTVFGYRLRTIGQNVDAARYAGMPVTKIRFLSFACAGGLAGLAGFGEVAGIYHNLPNGLSPGFGFTGIVVALLARLNPVWAVIIAFALAALNVGSGGMQRAMGIPVSLVSIMEAVLILLVLSTRMLERRA